MTNQNDKQDTEEKIEEKNPWWIWDNNDENEILNYIFWGPFAYPVFVLKKILFNTIIGPLLLVFFILIFIINTYEQNKKDSELKEFNAATMTYQHQLDELNRVENALKQLTEFIHSEQNKIEMTEKRLSSMKLERQQLDSILTVDKVTINAILNYRSKLEEERLSSERWIGFGIGIASSLFASIVFATVKRFSIRKKIKSK